MDRLYLAGDRAAARAAELGPSALDLRGARFHLGLHDEDEGRTCFEGIARAPVRWPEPDASRALAPRLMQSLRGAIRGRCAALALSGGVDAALIGALLRELGARDVPAYVLSAPSMPGYDETDGALAVARGLGLEVTVLRAEREDFVAALPAAVEAAETAFWNLHPASRLLLARRMASDGVEVVLTGDGADDAWAHRLGERWLPIAAALVEACTMHTVSPYVDDGVLAWVRAQPPDAGKEALRALGERLAPGLAVWRAPKTPRLAPEMDVSRHAGTESRQLAGALGLAETDVRAVSLGLLARTLEAPCAASPAS